MAKFFALAAIWMAAATLAGAASTISRPKVVRVLEVGSLNRNVDTWTGAPRAGDSLAFANLLYEWTGKRRGRRVGRDAGLCKLTFVDVERGRARGHCTVQFFLPRGSIVTQSFIYFKDSPLKVNVAVTGGTGVYASARGWLRVRDIASARSGKSALTFHLTP